MYQNQFNTCLQKSKQIRVKFQKFLNTIIFLLILNSISSTKDEQMENMINEYLQEKMASEQNQNIQNSSNLNFEQEKVRQFRIIEYLFQQPEIETLTRLTSQEQQCFELKRFNASLPFNNPLLETSNFFSSTRDQFQGISLRSLIYKLLLDKSFMNSEHQNSVIAVFDDLLESKQEFINIATEKENRELPIVYGGWKKILEKANNELESLESEKLSYLNAYSKTQNKILELINQIQEYSNSILLRQDSSYLLVKEYRDADDFVDIVSIATNPLMFMKHTFLTTSQAMNNQIKQAVKVLSFRMHQVEILEESKKFMTEEKYSNDKTTQNLISKISHQIDEKMGELNKGKKWLITLSKEIMKSTKEQLFQIPKYKDMLNQMNEYKLQLKVLYSHYENLVKVNREIDKLQYIIFETNEEETQKRALLDYFIQPETSVIIQNKIDQLKGKTNRSGEFTQKFEQIQQLDMQNTIYNEIKSWTGWGDNENQEIKRLKKLKELTDRIIENEIKVDFFLASAMNRTRLLTIQGEFNSNNQKCLDDLELGHLILNMSKSYMIADLDQFIKTFMFDWHLLDVRAFVLLNYNVFTSEDYQGRIMEDYPIQKIPPNQQESKKEEIIFDYALRLNFFIGMYRHRQIEIDTTARSGFF